MEGKNIPPIITLSAAMISCLICIWRGASLYTTLKIVLITMVIFYIIGRIAQKILVKIDQDAEEAALERQRIEQELAAKELEVAELEKQKQAENASLEENETENSDTATNENMANGSTSETA